MFEVLSAACFRAQCSGHYVCLHVSACFYQSRTLLTAFHRISVAEMPPKAAQGAAVDHDSEEKAKDVDKKKPDTKVGKAKAKASGKAKASPKPKAKAKAMKKNADAAAKKRPAASTGTLNQTIEELQQAAHGLNEKRDKGKALKYQRMKETGSLPQHIVHLVEEEAKRATSKRSFVTATINKLFTRNNDGTLALNLKDPMFVEAQNIYTKHFSKATQKALPQSIMIGLYFGNSLTAFQEAVKRGDVTEVDGEDGKTYYAFQSYEVGREDGKETVQTRTGKQQLTNQMAKELSKAFDAVGWNFRGKSAGDLVKEDGGLTEPTCQLLKQASESQARC